MHAVIFLVSFLPASGRTALQSDARELLLQPEQGLFGRAVPNLQQRVAPALDGSIDEAQPPVTVRAYIGRKRRCESKRRLVRASEEPLDAVFCGNLRQGSLH